MDSHTAGEATRLIVDGTGTIPGATMAAKRSYFQEHLDHIRLLLTREPRGHRDLLAAALTEPVTPGASFGLIYMDARRYPHLCGHATIGAVTTVLETGAIPRQHSSAQNAGAFPLLVDTPAGPMPVAVQTQGRRAESVSFTTMPCFVFAKDIPLKLPAGPPHLERVRIDLVCVGGMFAMADMDQPGLDLAGLSRQQITDLGMRIIARANEQVHVFHPERRDVTSVDVVEFYRHRQALHGESLVVYGEGHLDRSPCGTGTAAKVTLLHHRGCLAPGKMYVNAGPLGTTFTACIQDTTMVGEFSAVTVSITGSAHITGRHEFVLDHRDPFPQGFLL